MDERDLIARARAGEPAAERALYDAHVDRVYRLAYRLAGDVDLARDFTQETFIRAFERLDTFRGDSRWATWLHAITTTVALNGLRKVKRFRTRETALEAADGVASNKRTAEPDLKTRLRDAIDALPEKYRAVVVMHDVEGYTHEEIGELMGKSVSFSKSQLARAHARLRRMLGEGEGAHA